LQFTIKGSLQAGQGELGLQKESKGLRQVEIPLTLGRSVFCVIQTFIRLDETHPMGGQSALLKVRWFKWKTHPKTLSQKHTECLTKCLGTMA
jgi:hypothetical protein